MDIKEIIEKKANNFKLSENEIYYAVNAYTSNEITDYHMSALLTAIYINGMDDTETFYLTTAMLKSGEVLDLSDLGTTVDKHSTGGVSDTTTLILVPVCACLGVKMLKLSGRGLGHTGGTADKLEAFAGFDACIGLEKAKDLVRQNGGCMLTTTQSIAPADKKIYGLRDSINMVSSMPLIVSSIMSKKLASGADIIVLDIKYGNGAFMKTKKQAKLLAQKMCKIGKMANKKMLYVLGSMNEPLGYNIGPALEAYEAIEVLNGKKGKLYNATVELATKCLTAAKNISVAEAKKKVTEVIESKKALEKFKQMVASQGGSLDLFNGFNKSPTITITSNKSGKVLCFNTKKLGEIAGLLGSARKTLSDCVDYFVGIKTFVKIGNNVKKGDVLMEVYAKTIEVANQYKNQLQDTIIIK